MFELKIVITFLIAISIFLWMEYLHKKECRIADQKFKQVMKSLADNAKRETEG